MVHDRPIDLPTSSFASVYDRRRLAAAAGMLPDLRQVIPRWPIVGGGRRVIVLGGGIAGLCAAWSLREAGFQPLLLERTSRVGGRFYTLRNHFGDQYVELGVTRIAETHVLTVGYARHFGLPLVDYPVEGARMLFSLLGKRFASTTQGTADYPDDFPLSPEERKLDAEALSHFYTRQLFARIGDPRDAAWPPAGARGEFAGETFRRSLDRSAASLGAKEICRAYDGTEIDVYDALGWLAIQRLDTTWERSYAIPGGNDRLTTAFATSLGDCIVTAAHVQRVTSGKDRISVGYLRDGREETVEGDFVVCAIPHRILSEITFHPPLSEGKRSAAVAIQMLKVTRLNFQFTRRFWTLDERLQGLLVACTTSPIERLWDLTTTQPGSHGILTAYVQDHNAEALDELPTAEAQIAHGLTVMESFFPDARRHFVKGLSFSWHKQPWVKGAWSLVRPDQTDKLADLQRAEARVYLAGDHTSLYSGWAQGALESAHFAVAEVIAAGRGSAQIAP